MPQIEGVWNANMQVYGADKVWMQMNCEGTRVARCTVERLMAVRARKARFGARRCERRFRALKSSFFKTVSIRIDDNRRIQTAQSAPCHCKQIHRQRDACMHKHAARNGSRALRDLAQDDSCNDGG